MFPRALLASLAIMIPASAIANPLAVALSEPETPPHISDPTASDAREAQGEGPSEATLDSADLSRLAARLSLIAAGYEAFAHPSHAAETRARTLVQYASPHGLIADASDRTGTLDRVYRALALADYTFALRYAEGEACARERRRALLRSPDGLFADPKTGELAAWLKAELKRAQAGDPSPGLIAASAREWSPASYLRALAELRALNKTLADESVLGGARAQAHCARGALEEDLASAQRVVKWVVPVLPTGAVAEVRFGPARGTALLLRRGNGIIALVPGRLSESPYEAPDLYAKSGKRLSAAYERRGETLTIMSVTDDPAIAPLELPAKSGKAEGVLFGLGHTQLGGAWSLTRGLGRVEGPLVRTDAVLDESQAGGPLFDENGALAAVAAAPGLAYGVEAVRAWIEGAALPGIEMAASDSGTGALLTASAAFSEGPGLVEAGSSFISNPAYKCVDPRGCSLPPPSSSGGSSVNPYIACPPPQCYPRFLAPVVGIFKVLGKLMSSPPKRTVKLRDDRRVARETSSESKPSAPPPPPPKPPLAPSALTMTISSARAARGEAFSVEAVLAFTGVEGAKSGHALTLSAGTKGLDCGAWTRSTDASGKARWDCVLPPDEREAPFDDLDDEVKRRRGRKTPGKAGALPPTQDEITRLKRRVGGQMDDLDAEAAKHPEAGNAPIHDDTPGLEPHQPVGGEEEIVIKGDRVTLGVVGPKGMRADASILITDRPCPGSMTIKSLLGGRFMCRESSDRNSAPPIEGVYSQEADSVAGETDSDPPPATGSKEADTRPANLPENAIQNPHRPGSWGELVDGKFVERWRIDPGRRGAPGWRGKTHVHVNQGKEHLPPETPYPGKEK